MLNEHWVDHYRLSGTIPGTSTWGRFEVPCSSTPGDFLLALSPPGINGGLLGPEPAALFLAIGSVTKLASWFPLRMFLARFFLSSDSSSVNEEWGYFLAEPFHLFAMLKLSAVRIVCNKNQGYIQMHSFDHGNFSVLSSTTPFRPIQVKPRYNLAGGDKNTTTLHRNQG
jgi:hypothetical protein